MPPIDFIPWKDYILYTLLTEGRRPEASSERSKVRSPRPAGMPVPGGPGLHLEVTMDLPPGAG